MIHIPNLLTRLFKDKTEVAIFFSAFLLEIAVGIYLILRWGFTFNGGDAVAHLYIARTVIDNGASSGLQNLGTVWLPMFHLLVMPLVLIDSLYTTGFAGTIVNALATGGICVILYRLIGGRGLGILGSALLIGNVFTLIYGATPMMEQTAIFFMVLAAYYFKSYWETDNITEFMKCSLALIFGTLTRYEVWAVAFLVMFFFALRELKNGQGYRIAYIHLPLWGIFAWLFWNLAIFRDPLMFIHHPLSAQVQAIGDPRIFYAGSVALTTSALLKGLFSVSGLLWIFAILSIITLLVTRGRLSSTLVGVLLASPLAFQWFLMFIGTSVGAVHFFYMPFFGLIFLALNLVKVVPRSIFKSVLMVAILLVSATYCQGQLQMVAHNDPELEEFAYIHQAMEMMQELKALVGNEKVLFEPGTGIETSGIGLSVLTGTSPYLIIDPRDNPLYNEAIYQPWKYCSFVVLGKTQGSPQLNSYYEGKYYAYLYYNDPLWKTEFLNHFELVLETETFLVFQLKEGQS